MVGSKCRTLCQPITIGGIVYPGAYPTAIQRANIVAAVFPGISWAPTDPQIWVFVNRIPGYIDTAPNPSVWQVTGPNGPTMQFVPNINAFVFELRVIIKQGTIQPLIAVPWFSAVPGLGAPLVLQVESSMQFENPPGLTL
jgi:hypothetical protein